MRGKQFKKYIESGERVPLSTSFTFVEMEEEVLDRIHALGEA